MLWFIFAPSWLSIPGLLLLGFSMLSVNPVLMAWVQERFTNYRAFANGIYFAMNFVFRSGVVVIIGWIADRYGLQTSYLIGAGMMLLAIPVIWLLPETRTPVKIVSAPPQS